MREPERSRVFSVRKGEVAFSEVMDEIEELERQLTSLLETSELPPQPDHAAVNAFLVRAYQQTWANGRR